jgi:hypothetical protein
MGKLQLFDSRVSVVVLVGLVQPQLLGQQLHLQLEGILTLGMETLLHPGHPTDSKLAYSLITSTEKTGIVIHLLFNKYINK